MCKEDLLGELAHVFNGVWEVPWQCLQAGDSAMSILGTCQYKYKIPRTGEADGVINF
jgi:hypothetical protein